MIKKIDLKRIRKSTNNLLLASEERVNIFLEKLSTVLLHREVEIINANRDDMENAGKKGFSTALTERLRLDKSGIGRLMLKLRDLTKLQSGIGEVIEERNNDSNLLIKKVRTPLGVIAIIYEARPEVTIDVAALCVKSRNVAILKGGSEAILTNKVLYRCIRMALKNSGLDENIVNFIETSDRKVVNWLLQQNGYIDLVIARGGYNLVKSVLKQSSIPVLSHASGGARIYIDKSADLNVAEEVVINAKVNKPAACNSLDTIVLHQDVAKRFLPAIILKLKEKGVKIVNKSWSTEFLDLYISIKIVRNIAEAVEFINLHSKKHSEGIVSTSRKAIDFFSESVDSAAIFVNCSTRLHDGYVFGLGSEMGISTGKLHARGPVGLKELTTYKWKVYGNGQIRE